MESVEAEGHSIDEAIAQALQRLGVSRDRVEIEILANATRGILGLGGRRAKVRATVRRPLSLTPSHSPAPAPAPRPASAQPPPRPARPRSAPPPRAAQPSRPQPAAEVPPVDDAMLERARTVLADVVRLCGIEASVVIVSDEAGARLVIEGDPGGLLIGRHGQTLDALEYLINRVVAHEDDATGRLMVDAQDYRARRRQSLEELALRPAERARRRGKPVTLEPMSPRDRRIVHLALQTDPGLTTRSAGSGYYRKLVIIPAGARRAGRSRSPSREA